MSTSRVFTLEEAEALLPDLVPILERLRGLNDRLTQLNRALTEVHWHVRGNGKDASSDDLERKRAEHHDTHSRIRLEVQKLTEQGVEVKDLEKGLIDFPHQREGRIVYLCWKLGEQGIHFWHEVAAGYAGRQPL